MVEKRTPSQRLIEGATEALAIARGEQPAAAIWIDGHQYVPAEEILRLRVEVAALTAEAYSLTSLLATARRERAEAMERAAQIAETQAAEAKVAQYTCSEDDYPYASGAEVALREVAADIRQAGKDGGAACGQPVDGDP